MSKAHGENGEKKMKEKKYLKELRKLQGELCKLQEWVKHKGCARSLSSKGAWTIRCASGNLALWTCRRAASGSITLAPGT